MCLETPELPELDSSAALPAQARSRHWNSVFSHSAGRALGPLENTPDVLQHHPVSPLAQPSLLTPASWAIYSIPGLGESWKASN